MTITKKLSLLAAVGMAMAAAPAFAATTYTWIGGSTSSADWRPTTNWSPTGRPDVGDTAVFHNSDQVTFTADIPASVAEIDVQGTAQVTLNQSSGSMSVGIVQLTTTSSGTQFTIDPTFTLTTTGSVSLAASTTLNVYGTMVNQAGIANSGGSINIGDATHNALLDNQAAFSNPSGSPTCTINANATLKFETGASLTGTASIVDHGTFLVQDISLNVPSTISLSDNSGAAWQLANASSAATMTVNTNYSLAAPFTAGTSCVFDVQNNTLQTTGAFNFTGGTPCSHVSHGASGHFIYDIGSCP